jgi:hypothetical protein
VPDNNPRDFHAVVETHGDEPIIVLGNGQLCDTLFLTVPEAKLAQFRLSLAIQEAEMVVREPGRNTN